MEGNADLNGLPFRLGTLTRLEIPVVTDTTYPTRYAPSGNAVPVLVPADVKRFLIHAWRPREPAT
jgi:hypothetical protein